VARKRGGHNAGALVFRQVVGALRRQSGRQAPQVTEISMDMPSWRYRPRRCGRQCQKKDTSSH
jgi:hypothetical protein